MRMLLCGIVVAVAVGRLGLGANDTTLLKGSWARLVEKAAFIPRDTAEDLVFDGKMWLSNGYYHGNKLSRDLWCSADGKSWTLVNPATPYDGYSEMVVFEGKMWAVKKSVWNSTDGKTWTKVLDRTPFGARGYGELVVFQDKMWQLGSGADVWNTADGVHWTRVVKQAPYGRRRASAVAVHDGKLWVMGGRFNKPRTPPEKGYKTWTSLNDVWCSADGKAWTQVVEEAPWAPRTWFIAKVYRGRLWIIGGYDNIHHTNFADVWHTADGKTWEQFAAQPSFKARHEPTCYIYRDSLWVVAGNTWPVVNDVWRLTVGQP